ncbi:MAG: hypothetical protein RBU21_11275, partial [FCB group bacterium]|nr:hypothetical protein [FCB group bacterium]
MARYGNVDAGFATLRDALSARTVPDLKLLAALFAKELPTRKDDLIAVIEKALAGDGLRKMWESMDPLSRAAVAEVTHGKDAFLHMTRFAAKYGEVPRRHRYNSYQDKNIPWTLLDVVFTPDEMPRDLKERFRAFVPPPMPEKVVTLDALPEAVPVDEDSEESEMEPLEVCQTTKGALHDVVAVLRLVDAGKVTVSATTLRPALGGAKAVLAVLRDGDFVADKEIKKADDFIRAFAWPLIVQAAGWARLAGSKLELTKTGRDALARPAHEGIRHAWKRWLDKGLIDEFSRIDAIKGQNRKKNGGLTRVAPRRAALQKILSTCPPEKWIDIDEFFRHILASDIEYEVADDPWSLYITDAQYGNLDYGGGDTWSMVEGRYAMVLLWEYAATLGLLDIAHVPPDWARDDYMDHWGAEDLECLSRYD